MEQGLQLVLKFNTWIRGHQAAPLQGRGNGGDSVGNDTITAIAPALKWSSLKIKTL
jgi:hypothetical protein